MPLPKYIVNFDELTDELKKNLLSLIDDELKDKYPQLNTNNIIALMESLKELLPDIQYEGLKKKIDGFVHKNIIGIQKVEGRLIEIPAIINKYKEVFKFDKDIYLTGLHIKQTAWKKEDTYNLEVKKNKLINEASTKEIGEHKYFNTFYKVNANTPISFILNNKSGNSRQTLVDLEYIYGEKNTTTIDPPKNPTIDKIENDWDIAVTMQWEKTENDVDLHGIIGDKHVSFQRKKYPNFYLNYDYTNHKHSQDPEILSVKGYKNKSLEIYIHNYGGESLKEPVNIKIYNKKPYGNKLLKEINIKLGPNNSYLNGVCSIDLNTYKITTLNKKINVIMGGI